MFTAEDNEDFVVFLLCKIYQWKVVWVERMIRDSAIPKCVSSKDFISKVRYILLVKRYLVFNRCRKYFDTCCEKMLSSHQDYLTFVMFAIINEHNCYKSICESFISVCAFVELLCEETSRKARVNFYSFIPDIIMIYYHNLMREVFCRPNMGIQRFIEYICGHRYLKWELKNDYSISPYDPNAVFYFIDRKIENELKVHDAIEKDINPDEVANDEKSQELADYVIEVTSFVFPNLPNSSDLLKSVNAYKKTKAAIIEKDINPDEVANDEKSQELADNVIEVTTFEFPNLPNSSDLLKSVNAYKKTKAATKKENQETEGFNGSLHMGSNSKSETNYDPQHQDSIEQYEKIIQKVMKHNCIKRSNNESWNNPIQKEADEIIEHLSRGVESLIDILDKLDDE